MIINSLIVLCNNRINNFVTTNYLLMDNNIFSKKNFILYNNKNLVILCNNITKSVNMNNIIVKNKDDNDLLDNFITYNKNLMINDNSYGIFYSTKNRLIKPHGRIILDKQVKILNFVFNENTSDIIALNTGVYLIHITCHFDRQCRVLLYNNNNNNKSKLSILGKTDSNNVINIHQLVNISSSDVIKLKNYSSKSIKTILTNFDEYYERPNIIFEIYKI